MSAEASNGLERVKACFFFSKDNLKFLLYQYVYTVDLFISKTYNCVLVAACKGSID
jgi:hypothetical protein